VVGCAETGRQGEGFAVEMELLLGLGGNVGDPPCAFRTALTRLAREHRLLALSQLYRSEPEGPPQPRFWNMAVRLELRGSLLALLHACHDLERAAGRLRVEGVRWGPRSLDLDLLLSPDVVHRGPRLELPHPRVHLRAFALQPAVEVAPDWVVPGIGRSVADLAREASRNAPEVEPCGPLVGLGEIFPA
jgi:2-amino-4-hydroxy-6-hydroxymethyldihydropteridine diphosphokinase